MVWLYGIMQDMTAKTLIEYVQLEVDIYNDVFADNSHAAVTL
jgi:hypothetical protein